MTISVLHVTEPIDGGVGRVVSDLVRDQARRGWRVGLAAPSSPLAESAVSVGAVHLAWRVAARPQATRLDERPGVSIVSEAIHLRKLVRQWRPDVVHLHSAKAGLAGRIALRGGWPTVFQPHGWSFHAVDGRLRSAVITWERVGARWADAIVCVSEGERRLGEQAGLGLRANWHVVPNGINLASHGCNGGGRQAARQTLGLDGTPLVVCVGRLSRAKGQDVLLQAWPAVLNELPDARLVLVGEGPDKEALERRALPGATFIGHREDVPAWLEAADVVAMPSRWEGMSVTMLEAMAHGRCIVSTAVPGATDALGAGNGALVPVEDAEAFGRAVVQRLLDADLREREGHAARLAAERDYDLRYTTQRMAKVYAAVLARRAPRSNGQQGRRRARGR